MFIRLRVSAWNLDFIDEAVREWTKAGVPVVLTLMRYYDLEGFSESMQTDVNKYYVWKKSTSNDYYCPTPKFIMSIAQRYHNNMLTTLCGTFDSGYCKDCKNCETYYWQTKKRMDIHEKLGYTL